MDADEQTGLGVGPGAGEVMVAYQAETRMLLGSRLQTAAVFFLLFGGAISLLEVIYFPNRRGTLLIACIVYVAVCVGALVTVRLAPARTFATAVLATNGLALTMIWYSTQIHNRAEMLVLTLGLFLSGVTLLFPWGLRGQILGSLGAVAGFLVAIDTGTAMASPAPYGSFALATAVGLTALGARLLESHRFAAYHRAVEFAQAERFSTALLQVARAINATINDPLALAQQLTDQSRAVLAADWTVLYTAAPSEEHFRVAALSHAPPGIAEELRTVGFRPEYGPVLYQQLKREGSVELIGRTDRRLLPPDLLERWNVAAVLFQAIMRDAEVIGILGCCYVQPRARFGPRERRLMVAVANQAAVALENARLMEEARAASRIKSEFVATVSHELRTPLNVIIGYTDLLRDGAFADTPTQHGVLDRIHQQSIQLLDLIQAMLDVNRLDAGGVRLTIEEFDVSSMFAGLREHLPSGWCRPGVSLQWETSSGSRVLRTDRSKLEMILRNLIHNALKYTEAGAVTVAPHSDHGRVQFMVADTGPGIAPGDLASIFEMFRQGTGSPPRDGGVGLGLYIVKRLTEALGGGVHVESRLGGGARFSVVVPVDAPRGRVA